MDFRLWTFQSMMKLKVPFVVQWITSRPMDWKPKRYGHHQHIEFFISKSCLTQQAPFESLQILLEGGLAKFFSMEDVPLITRHLDDPKKIDNVYWEILKVVFGKSKYSFAGLFFVFLYYTNAFIPKRKIPKYNIEFEAIKGQMLVRSILYSVLLVHRCIIFCRFSFATGNAG